MALKPQSLSNTLEGLDPSRAGVKQNHKRLLPPCLVQIHFQSAFDQGAPRGEILQRASISVSSQPPTCATCGFAKRKESKVTEWF